MKKIKLGMRLNPYNRRKIALAVVDAQLGGRLENLKRDLAALGKDIYAALFDLYAIGNLCADGADVTTIVEGTLPTAQHITVTSEDGETTMNIPFGGEKPLPYCYTTGDINTTLFNDLPMFGERVMGVFPKHALVERQASDIEYKMVKYLEQHKTLRTVIEETPGLADIIPDEYCEPCREGKSLDSILHGDAA